MGVLLLAVAAIGMLAVAPAAFAGKPLHDLFAHGTSFNGLTVDQATGDVLATNSGSPLVERFDADGEPVGQFGATDLGGPAGEIAVASDGAIYVADTGNNRIARFTAAGTFDAGFGSDAPGGLLAPQGVDVGGDGTVYVADTGNGRVLTFDSSGEFLDELALSGPGSALIAPTDVAVDSVGRVYVVGFDPDAGFVTAVRRYASDGTFEATLPVLGVFNLAVDVNRSDDHVFVAGDMFAETPVVVEVDAAGTVVDTHGPAIPGGHSAVGVNAATGRIFAAFFLSPFGIAILDEPQAPAATVSIELPTSIGSASASLSGTVDPNGDIETIWHFEVSDDGGTSWSPVGDEGTIAAGDGVTTVTTEATGLQANSQYLVRLVASKGLGIPDASDQTDFTTDAAPPAIRALAAGARTDDAAWLGANVNPRNSATTYYVEYALASDTAYASSQRVPTAPTTADVGDGSQYVTVSQLVTGLEPSTAYRFRVVAENATGTTAGSDRVFTTRAELPSAPAGRAYEMVSPLDKNGGNVARGDLQQDFGTLAAAETGNAVAYPSSAQFADARSGAPISQYLSERTGAGWITRNISPSLEADVVNPPEITLPGVPYISADLTQAVVRTNVELTDGAYDLLGRRWGLYLSNIDKSGYRLLSDPWTNLPPASSADGILVSNSFVFSGASSDMRHVVFNSRGPQLTPVPIAAGAGAVYMWSDGQLELVSRLADGEPAPNAVGGAALGDGGGDYPGDHLVSEDGNRVYFTFGSALYMREGGETTYVVSRSERPEDLGTVGNGTFWAAEASTGDRALFTSGSPLTIGTTTGGAEREDLYIWDRAAPEGSRLTNLTSAATGGAGVRGIAATSRDLSHTYFVATAALTDDAVEGRPNLYVWLEETGDIRLIGALSTADGAVWSARRTGLTGRYRDARISTDGTKLVFASASRLTSYDNAGLRQVYLYDARTGELSCVSCDPSRSVATASAGLFPEEDIYTPYRLPRNLSADGSTVFFETTQALSPGDVNGKADVYQWKAGELSLLSGGQGSGSHFMDASADGKDVFITTRERLVGADVDDQSDMYDIRVGGGFAEQQLPPRCVADACQGQPSVPSSRQRPPSATLDGAGNAPRSTRTTLRLGRVSVAQRRRVGRSGVLALRIGASQPAVLHIGVRAEIRGRRRLVARRSVRLREPRRLTVRLRLDRSVRRTLRRGHSVRLTIAARSPGARTLTMPVRLAGAGS